MESSKEAIRRTLTRAKVYLSQESPQRISEADTKANFIEPIVSALGWEGIGVVTREYYVRDSQEFIDYVMSGSVGPLLAIEAKSLRASLTDKNAAQLIQYCAVEGIEWAALTNGRELQFFNTFLKPDLAAKKILQLDLLAFNTDAEYAALFENLWQLSRESMTTSTGVRTWLNQRRLDKALRDILLNPGSPSIKQLRRILSASDISATPQDITQWVRSHLGTPSASVPIPVEGTTTSSDGSSQQPEHIVGRLGHAKLGEDQRRQILDALRKEIDRRWPDSAWRETKHYTAAAVDANTFLAIKARSGKLVVGLCLPSETSSLRTRPNTREFNWRRITQLVDLYTTAGVNDEFLFLVERARSHAAGTTRSHSHYGIALKDLVDAGVLIPGTSLILTAGKRDLANATLGAGGEIIWHGATYESPSDKVFAMLVGPDRTSLNGWTHWVVDDGVERKSLADLRQKFLEMRE